MSLTFTIKGNESVLSASFFPPIKLDENLPYFIGMIDFEAYNSIPNIDSTNNKFYYGNQMLELPTGTYELEQIEKYLQENLGVATISIKPETTTLKCCLSSTHAIDFQKPGTIGPLLGFGAKLLDANKKHMSDQPVQIMRVNVIMIDCNLVSGAYINGKEIHTVHQFAPVTPSGYKIIEVPQNVIYLPVKTKTIDNITLKLMDQDGNLLNFRKETITIRLHLKHGVPI